MNSTKPEHVQIADMLANVSSGPVGVTAGGQIGSQTFHGSGGGHRGLGKGSGKSGRKPANSRPGWDWTMTSLKNESVARRAAQGFKKAISS